MRAYQTSDGGFRSPLFPNKSNKVKHVLHYQESVKIFEHNFVYLPCNCNCINDSTIYSEKAFLIESELEKYRRLDPS